MKGLMRGTLLILLLAWLMFPVHGAYPQSDSVAEWLFEQGMALLSRGKSPDNLRSAIQDFKQASILFHSAGEAMKEGMCDFLITTCYVSLGDPVLTLEYAQGAMEVLQKAESRSAPGDLRISLLMGELYLSEMTAHEALNRHAAVLADLKNAERLLRKARDPGMKAGIDVALAQAYWSAGTRRWGTTLAYLKEAEGIFQAHPEIAGRLRQLGLIRDYEGVVYGSLMNYPEALKSLEGAAVIFSKLRDLSSLGIVEQEEGVTCLYMRQYGRALTFVSRAEKIQAKIGEYPLFVEGSMIDNLKLMQQIDDQLKEYRQAYRFGKEAIKRFNHYQSELFAGGSGSSALEAAENYRGLFSLTTMEGIRLGDGRTAFMLFNEGKMRVFRAEAEQNSEIFRLQETNPVVRKLWDERSRDLSLLAGLQLQFSGENFSSVKGLMKKEEETEDDFLRVDRRLNGQSAAYREVFGGKPTAVSDVQKALAPGDVLLEYAFLEGSLYLFMVRKNGLQIIHLLSPLETGRMIHELRDLLKPDGIVARESRAGADPKAGFSSFMRVARPLSKDLLGGAKLPSDTHRLFIVPDGALLFLPFEMLLVGRDFMVRKYEIAYLDTPSDLASPRQPEGDGFLGFGGIDYLAAVKPFQENQARMKNIASLESAARGALEGDGHLCGFPSAWWDISGETLEEVREIQGIMGGKIETGMQASKVEFLSEAPGKRYIHLATHGWISECVNSMNPSPLSLRGEANLPGEQNHEIPSDPLAGSFLLFAGACSGGSKEEDGVISCPEQSLETAPMENGYLTPLEVMGADLHGVELVTLSACQTGLGQVGGEEGVFGLRRAFQVAGAQNLILSEWEVPDKETEELMASFYAALKKGSSISAALREAEINEIAIVQKRYGHPIPYYWAAFVHVGK